MLEEIIIKDLGIIKDATLSFGNGLTCITGETGAGKTMVLSALGLLLGKRSDSSVVRAEAISTSVEGRFYIKNNLAIEQIVEDAGGNIDYGQLYINRTVFNDGRSKASAGGKGTPASVLGAIGDLLVSIHGQSDQVRLKSSNAQREALDCYNKNEVQPFLDDYRKAYYAWKDAKDELNDIKNNMFAREKEFEELTKAINDISKIQPEAGEDEKLKNSAERLANVEILKEATSLALNKLATDDYEASDASSLISEAHKILDNVSSYDNAIQVLSERADFIKTEVLDLIGELSSYLENIDVDALTELEHVQSRRAEIATLIRRYGPTLDDVLATYQSAVERIDALNPENNNVEVLESRLSELFLTMENKANLLSRKRQENAKEISSRINAELAGLAMSSSTIVIDVNKNDVYTSHGIDEVNFMLKPHHNSEARPISKAASGGELSRIMLALELVLADPDNVSTFIFDEIDSGVGGATATEIGKRLAQLARHTQVIVVTHLPQVAVFADNHLRVVKRSSEEFISTDVTVLNEQERINEITRMLSGLDSSETGQAHAKEMLAIASEFKHS